MTAPGDAAALAGVRVVVFDVNETLSDVSALADRFVAVGAPAALAPTWFASVLRDGFALTATGGRAPFAEVARAELRAVLAGRPLTEPLDDAVERVVAGFGQAPLHPDVAEGVERLASRGLVLATLSNGSSAVAEELLATAGLRDRFAAVLSVEGLGTGWKPNADAYLAACAELACEPGEALLVAVHPWDIHGARRAGLATAWVDRSGTASYPSVFSAPTTRAASLVALAQTLEAARR